MFLIFFFSNYYIQVSEIEFFKCCILVDMIGKFQILLSSFKQNNRQCFSSLLFFVLLSRKNKLKPPNQHKMATTLQEFSDKLDRLDAEFAKKMEEQNKKFFADKPDESTLSPEMKEHYEKFEKMIKEHTDKFNKKMRDHSEHFKQKFAELLEQQKNAQFPTK